MPDFVVVTAFRSKDQMSKDLKKMGLSAKNFGKIAGVSFKKAERSALSLKKVIGGVLGAAAIRRGIGLMQQGVAGIANEFLDFDDAITAAAGKFGIFNREGKKFEELKATAREVGATTEFTAPQAAEGLRFLAKAGWESASAMKALPSFVDLATASEMDFARAADIATDVMGAFQLQTKNADQNLTNLTRVNDVFAKAVNMANIDMEDMFETIKMAGPVANTAGVSLEKFAALTAFMGSSGIKGTLSGTAMRTMILSLTSPTKKAQGIFKKFNAELVDAAGNLRDPVEILKDLSKNFDSFGTAQKTAALNVLFGKRAVSGAAVSMEGARGALQKFEESLVGAKGESKKLAEFMRGSLSKRLDTLKSAVIDIGLSVLYAFEKNFKGGLDAATEAVRNFDPKPVIDGIKTAIQFTKDFISILREAKQIASDYEGILIGIGAAFVATKLASVVGAIIQIGKLMAALKLAGGLKAALGLVGLHPLILAIALAVGGLAAGIYTVVTRWEDLKRAVGWALEDIGAWLMELSRSIAGWFQEAWYTIKSGFANVVTWLIGKAKALGIVDFLGLTTGADALQKSMNALKKPPSPNDWSRFQKRQAAESMRANYAAGAFTSMNADLIRGGAAGLAAAGSAPTSEAQSSAAGFFGPVKTESLVEHVERQEKVKAQVSSYHGQLDINAPKDSKLTEKSKGSPPIRVEMMGANK